MGNLIVELGPASGERSLMLMAYAMTHPANRMQAPFVGEVVETENGPAVRGRGVSEQKGALAAALMAVKVAAEGGGLRGRLVFAVSTAGETGRHDAAMAIGEALGSMPKLSVVVLGTSGRIAVANKGRVDAMVTVRGRATHSSMPWVGIDAIAGARQVLDRVLSIDLGGREHSGLGAATITATSIRSWPEATHTLQDEVRLVFDRRLLPGEDPHAAFAAIAAAADIGAPWTITTEFGPFMYPAEIAPDGALARAIAEGCRRAGVPEAGTFFSHGALDSGYLSHVGSEAAMWGPGDTSLWHSDDERVTVADLVAGAAAYRGLIESYLG
jgi:acetylornithine deacetylase/succinyl-diaminopimelate desuccinylase-like protein